MAKQEMVVFTRCFDFLSWLLPASNGFPRVHRQTVTRRLLDAAFDVHEYLEAANHRQGPGRLQKLDQADEALDNVRVYLRLCARWQWLTQGQYRHVAEMVAEIGRLLGGWRQATAGQGSTRS